MDSQDIYKPPKVKLDEIKPAPAPIKATYALIGGYVFVGGFGAIGVIDFEATSFVFKYVFAAGYFALTLFIA